MSNSIKIAGLITEQPVLSYEIFGRKIYSFSISSKRKSGIEDRIPCNVAQNLVNEIEAGNEIVLYGEIRSRKNTGNEKTKSSLYVFVNAVSEYKGEDENIVELQGNLQKKSVLRKTNSRMIADMLLASKRNKIPKEDSIPCIAWGRNAYRVAESSAGTSITLLGRLQSREYTKKRDNGEKEKMTTYEVSVQFLELPEIEVSEYRKDIKTSCMG